MHFLRSVPHHMAHLYRCWLHDRTAAGTVWVVLRHLVPVACWLLLFSLIDRIPNHLKPAINVRLMMRFDEYVFDSVVGLVLTCTCILLGLALIYIYYYNKAPDLDRLDLQQPYARLPVVLIATSWLVLNGIYYFKEPTNKVKNIIALIFYVIGHFLVVPATAWYLYLFQPSKVLKTFVLILGVQGFCINLTHLLFPNVPPIYVQYYGENKNPNYDHPGYSEGLTRIDVNLKVLNYMIFYVKSIEFGILPLLHTSMSVTIVYFLNGLVRYLFITPVLLAYLFFQIWLSIYLNHHWRIDILFAFFYSTFFYLTVKDDVDAAVALFRQNAKFGETTMGMRVFRKTRLEWWFNPAR